MKLILFTNLSEMTYFRGKLPNFGSPGNYIALVSDCQVKAIGDGIPAGANILLFYESAIVNYNHSNICNWINDDSGVFVVIHRSSEDELKEDHRTVFINTSAEIIEQSHVKGSIYQEIDDWVKNGCNPALLSKIIKKHFPDKKLEAVLEFLHLCLNDKIEDDYLKILQDAGIEVGNGDNDSIIALFEKVKNPGKDTTKNQELATLRDALLAQLGIV